MRLIDADKLPAACNVAIVNGKIELDGWVAAKRIDEAPTVEAIPIEWLKYNVIGRKDLTFDKLELIWSIIKDWEKENEPQLSDEAICSIMENDMLYEKMERLDKELIKDWERENGNIQDK